MGRGDKRTKKGKIFAGSFGNARPARTKLEIAVEKKAEKAPKKKAAAKKTTAKKATTTKAKSTAKKS